MTLTEQGATADSLLVQHWYESAQPLEQNTNNRGTEDVPHVIQQHKSLFFSLFPAVSTAPTSKPVSYLFVLSRSCAGLCTNLHLNEFKMQTILFLPLPDSQNVKEQKEEDEEEAKKAGRDAGKEDT